ncbi:hypothetical protein COLO4_24376 [Corchorus olitorius]|uniref:Uncharacterized protein n=1 Tax=Corchorus olitorius TaxID=93759 RepID=A0A1R3IAI2_9ROSI|nr:hypothetical protein COLO4_24376 [Corchorus olitorius]
MEAISSFEFFKKEVEEGEKPRETSTNGDSPSLNEEIKESRKIIGVSQLESEDFGQYWERFKEACEDCLEYAFTDEELLQYFHESLTISRKRLMVHYVKVLI